MNDKVTPNQTNYDDEIDLVEIFARLWSSKLLIAASMLSSLILGGIFISVQDQRFESTVGIVVENLPPFYDTNKILSDYKDSFYDEIVFNSWVSNSEKMAFEYEAIAPYQKIQNFLFLKDVATQLATINTKKNGTVKIILRSNNYSVIDQLHSYAKYVGQVIDDKYIDRSKAELSLIQDSFVDITEANDSVFNHLLAVDRYVSEISSSGTTLNISRPTEPRLASVQPYLLLVMFGLVGIILSCTYVLVRHAILHRFNT